MSQHYFVLLTKVGQAQLSNALAMGRKLNVSKLQIGDGGADEGKETNPTENDTQLKRVRGEVPVNAVFQHESNPHWVVFQVVIPDDVGGFYITELGLFDEGDNLIAIGKYPKTYKATLPDGISTSMDLEVICQVGNVDQVNLQIDPSKVLATIDYTEKRFQDHLAAADPHPQYMPKAGGNFTGEISVLENAVYHEGHQPSWEEVTNKPDLSLASHNHDEVYFKLDHRTKSVWVDVTSIGQTGDIYKALEWAKTIHPDETFQDNDHMIVLYSNQHARGTGNGTHYWSTRHMVTFLRSRSGWHLLANQPGREPA
ncbi:phage tail protein [Spartinivicinus ruber]|uniref:phage tail protein n=1 Tax=Spartinivicinus ruber TaxID=2683272 RepID=UPI0013D73E79|nr:phage tail protein [Spartinivicinus ruber]